MRRTVDALRLFAKNWLPLLFNAFIGTAAGQRAGLAAAISAYARVCDQGALSAFFRNIIKKLIKVLRLLLP